MVGLMERPQELMGYDLVFPSRLSGRVSAILHILHLTVSFQPPFTQHHKILLSFRFSYFLDTVASA